MRRANTPARVLLPLCLCTAPRLPTPFYRGISNPAAFKKDVKRAHNLPEGEQEAAGRRTHEDEGRWGMLRAGTENNYNPPAAVRVPPPPTSGAAEQVDPQYPFLLCHGLLGFDTLKVVPSLIEVDYWRGGIAQTLRRRRRPEEGALGGVFISRVPSTGHVHERALCIKKQVIQILDPPLAPTIPGIESQLCPMPVHTAYHPCCALCRSWGRGGRLEAKAAREGEPCRTLDGRDGLPICRSDAGDR
jgi:hypothetical protein